MLHWFSEVPGHFKYKYDFFDFQWIDLEAMISTLTMTVNPPTNIYTLDQIDVHGLDEFVYYQT